MRIKISDDIVGIIDAETFVIKVFDAIKCAAATGNTVDINLNRAEVQHLAAHIEDVDWLEIHEGCTKKKMSSYETMQPLLEFVKEKVKLADIVKFIIGCYRVSL